MRLLVDTTVPWRYRTETAEHGNRRRYYCAAMPHRAILVCRNGLELADLRGKVVDAAVGYDDGWRDFVRAGNEKRHHTKVTIYRVTAGRPEARLSEVLERAPRDE